MDFDLNETIGIDFGTSFSTVSKYENGKVVLVEDEYQSPYIPTYISYKDGKYTFGRSAFQAACTNTGNTVYEIKRLIGHSYGDEVISKCKEQMPYVIVDDHAGGIKIEIKSGQSKQQFHIVDLINLFVYYLKGLAEKSLNHEVKNCIITVPSYFNASQRSVIHSAVRATELNVLSILTEPTAAALAYDSIDNQSGKTKTMAVYDFGGGTFDVSIIQKCYGTYEVLATSGDTEVGGKDLTRVVIDYLKEKLKEYPNYADYCTTPLGLEIIRNKAEEMKIDLTLNTSTSTFIEKGEDEIEIVLERGEFERRIAPLVQRTIDVVLDCIRCVNMESRDIESIILIGGSSFIPCIKDLLQKQFPGCKILNTVDTRAAVATGALHYGCLRKEGKEFSENANNTVVLKSPGEMFSAASLIQKQATENTMVVDGVTLTLAPPPLPAEYEESSTSFDLAAALIDKTLKNYPQCPDSVSIFEVLEKAGIQIDKNWDVNTIQTMDLVNHALTQSTMADYFKEKTEVYDGQEVHEDGEYVFGVEPTIFTDVTPLSIGYVDSNRRYHELIKRNEKLPVSRSCRFTCTYTKNMSLNLTIADSRDPGSGEYSIIGCARLDNVPMSSSTNIQVIANINIDTNNMMKVTLKEKQSGIHKTYFYNGVFDNIDSEVQQIRERNKGAFSTFNEKAYRNSFNDELYEKMHIMEAYVRKTGDEDCKITLKEMREVLKRQDEFTVEQLKEIMGKVYQIMRLYHIL